MRISGLWCKCDTPTYKQFPVDHYESMSCPKPPIPIADCLGIMRQQKRDKVHRDLNMTITRTLGCPRQVVLEDEFDHVIKIEQMLSSYEGTVEHERWAKNAPPGWYAEVTIPRPGQEPVTLFGVPMTATLDTLRADYSAIEEYKKHSESSQKWKYRDYQEGKMDWELAVQVNGQRILLEKATGHDVPDLYTWHGAMTAAAGPPNRFRVTLPRMTEEEMAAVRPFGSKLTVQENVDYIMRYKQHVKAGISKEDAAKRIPTEVKTSSSAKDTEPTSATSTAQQGMSATGSGDDNREVSEGTLGENEFLRLTFRTDGGVNVVFDPDAEKQPNLGTELATMIGNCHMAMWQVVNWADTKLHSAAAFKQRMQEFLEQSTPEGVN